jgi:replicative superfamily II helicase
MKIADLDAPPDLITAWSHELDELTPIQEAAIEAGVLTGDNNLLIVAPTSSGKSLIGEIAATKAAFGGKRHAIFAVPMRSLADEHYLRMKERYRNVLSVVISTGDWADFDDNLRTGSFDLAILTYEKLAIMLLQVPSLLDRCGCVVIDEAQMIGDRARGARLEMLITQLLIHPARPRIVALSASLDELNQLHAWLGAKAIVASERPVPLDLAVCSAASGVALLRPDRADLKLVQLGASGLNVEGITIDLALRQINDAKQVIIFRTQVPSTERMAGQLAQSLPAKGMDKDLGDELATLEDPEAPRRFRHLLAAGVGFHNADLAADERRLMERAFRSQKLSVLVATTTLAMGVNMPADVVIVADHMRVMPGTSGWATTDISVAEYRNAAGRAGRLGLKAAGLAILIAEDDIKRRQLFSHYVEGDVEAVMSRLPDHPMEDVVFRLLAGRLAETEKGLADFLGATFAFPTWYEAHGGFDAIRAAVHDAVDKTRATGLVLQGDSVLAPTPVAHSLSRAGVGLDAAVRLKTLIDSLLTVDVPRVELLFELTLIPESGDRPFVPGKPGFREDTRPQLRFDLEGCAADSALVRALNAEFIDDVTKQALLQCACLIDWSSGRDSREIGNVYKGVSLHRLGSMGGTCAWLLQALTSAAKVAGIPAQRLAELRRLILEITYGLPAELAPLARLRSGISRSSLLRLYEGGIYQLDDVLEADTAKLESALSAGQIARLKQAIVEDTEATLRRFRTGHLRRTNRSGLSAEMIEALYSAKGVDLEEAVEEALNSVGLRAVRVLRQPAGEEDIQISTSAGPVVVSVTASDNDQKPIAWNKAKQVMAQGAGQNPINCVCIARPRFERLAEVQAAKIARETGARSVLLIPMPVFAEMVSRVGEGTLTTADLDHLMAQDRGLLALDDLPDPHEGGARRA